MQKTNGRKLPDRGSRAIEAGRTQSHHVPIQLPPSGLVQQNLSVIRKIKGEGSVPRASDDFHVLQAQLFELRGLYRNDEPSAWADSSGLVNDIGPPLEESPSLVPQLESRPTFAKKKCGQARF